jgi:uncharacterized protein
MSSIKYLFVVFSFLVFVHPRFETQNSLPNCGERDKRETICRLAGCNQLMIAAENGELNRVRALLGKGADVNARSKSGHTALILAAAAGHLEVVKALLNAGADANTRAYSFHSGEYLALMSAMDRCNKDWLKILDGMIAAGAEVNPKETFSRSPLMYAITRYDLVLVKALIARGADVNLKNELGTTPLMTVIMSRGPRIEMVKLLMEAGADPNARDQDGQTALSLLDIHATEETERAELSRLLRKQR